MISSADLKSPQVNRWSIAVAAVVMQLCLGTVYAWSVFKKPLMHSHGWSETATQAAFMICIGMIGLSAALGGALVDKKGPRLVATAGAILFGIGTVMAGLADYTGNIYLLYLGYGFIGGGGNGIAYVTPIATLIRWFPDRRGLVTGLAVMGFGGGAFVMGQVAPTMINELGIARTWMYLGVILLILTVITAWFFINPPQGWLPAGFVPEAAKSATIFDSLTFREAVSTRQWWILWWLFFFNIAAGVGLLSQLSPMAQDIQKQSIADPARLAVAGGAVVAIASIFNGLGRLFWAWLSDSAGRRNIFMIIFISEIVLYILLPHVRQATLFSAVACYLLACYGGGFSVMPAFVADSFGAAHVGKIYGSILTAWGAAGIVGPLIFAHLKDTALYIAAVMLMMGLVLTVIYQRPVKRTESMRKQII